MTRDPLELPALRPGHCNACGKPTRRDVRGNRMKFCDSDCRTAYWRRARMRGGQIYPMLELWRRYRGRKGTPGEHMLSEIARLVDEHLAADNASRRTDAP